MKKLLCLALVLVMVLAAASGLASAYPSNPMPWLGDVDAQISSWINSVVEPNGVETDVRVADYHEFQSAPSPWDARFAILTDGKGNVITEQVRTIDQYFAMLMEHFMSTLNVDCSYIGAALFEDEYLKAAFDAWCAAQIKGIDVVALRAAAQAAQTAYDANPTPALKSALDQANAALSAALASLARYIDGPTNPTHTLVQEYIDSLLNGPLTDTEPLELVNAWFATDPVKAVVEDVLSADNPEAELKSVWTKVNKSYEMIELGYRYGNPELGYQGILNVPEIVLYVAEFEPTNADSFLGLVELMAEHLGKDISTRVKLNAFLDELLSVATS